MTSIKSLQERSLRLAAEYADIKSDTTLTSAEKSKRFAGLTDRIAETSLEIQNAEIAEKSLRGLGQFKPVDTKGMSPAKAERKHWSPMTLADEVVQKGIQTAALDRETKRVGAKAFSGLSGLVAPAQVPGVLNVLQYESTRLLDHLRTAPMTTPSVSYIQHTATTVTNGPVAGVGEGAAKPEATFTTSNKTAAAIKLAVQANISTESIADFANWQGYCQGELSRLIIDAETDYLLNASSVGLLNASGILTRAKSTDTILDTFAKAINDLRVGSALAKADTLLLHPSDLLTAQLAKTSYGEYLLGAPGDLGATRLWGLDVLTSTKIAAGTGLMLDSSKDCTVWVREGISTFVDPFSGSGNNLVKLVTEQRISPACLERPAAVLKLTGLNA